MMDNRGFTLLELILYISIITIVLLIPIFKIDMFQKFREKQEIKEFIKDINYTRNRAIAEGVSHGVLINTKANSYTIYRIGDDGEKSIKHKKFNQGVEIKYNNIRDSEAVFNFYGVVDGAGTIMLENSRGKTVKITIVPVTGKVNVYYDEESSD